MHVHVYSANLPKQKLDKTVGEALEWFLTTYKIEKCELTFGSPEFSSYDAPLASVIGVLHPQLGNYVVTFIGCYCEDDFNQGVTPF